MGNLCSNENQRGKFKPPTMANNYYPAQHAPPASTSDMEEMERVIGGEHQVESKDLAQYILSKGGRLFRDEEFGGKDWAELSTLMNKRMNVVFEGSLTRFDSLKQNQLEMCYLTSAFYLVCANPQLKSQIFITNSKNSYQAYILHLFCNGKKTKVVIDETIPVQDGEQIKYLNVIRGTEIWPFLLEKAWCKQIGGYEKAKGLAPDDAIEEITGLPAYSYEMRMMSDGLIEDLVTDNNCYILLAAKHFSGTRINSRQIFYVDSCVGDVFYLRSPYFQFDYERQSSGSNRIAMNLYEMRSIFDYVTVGFCYQNHCSTSYPLKSNKNEVVSYILRIEKQQPINIRFIQFYEHYLKKKDQSGYDYSPVFIQLLNEKGQIVEGAEGCNNSASGSRSSNLFESLFGSLSPGRYYLQVEVGWLNEQALCEGNLVVYASEGNATLTRINTSVIPTYSSFHRSSVQPNEQIMIKFAERKHRYVIEAYNTLERTLQTTLTFQKVENIRVRGYQLQNNTISLSLKGKETKVITILPFDNRYPYSVEKFKIGTIQ